VARERAAIGADLGDASGTGQIFHELIARGADAAVRQQLRRIAIEG
jgi:hypothetical protein